MSLDIASSPAAVLKTVDQAIASEFEGRPVFPEYMRAELRETAVKKFDFAMQTARGHAIDLPVAAAGRLIYRIVFDTAVDLARTDEDRVTIVSPDAPRIGESIAHPDLPVAGKVTAREVVERDDEKTTMRISFDYDGKQGPVSLSALYEVKRPRPDADTQLLLDSVARKDFF